MEVSNQTNLSYMGSFLAEGVIEAAAVEGMTIGLHTIPVGATPILDTDKVILNKDPIPGVLPTLIQKTFSQVLISVQIPQEASILFLQPNQI